MEKNHRNPKLITLNCSYCNRKIHATIKQFMEGMECASCGMPVTLGADEQLSSGDSFLHKASCINCQHEFDIPFAFSFKYLAQCPECNTLFVRQNLILDETITDSRGEAFKLLETLYPALPSNINADPSDATPASEQELQLLRDLNIKAKNPTSLMVQRLAKNIFDQVHAAILTNYNAVLYFPNELRSKIYLAVAQSDLLRRIYFDQTIPMLEMEPVVQEALGDEELYRALCAIIDVPSYEIAVTYIKHYAQIVYEQDIDDLKARMLALRAFARGFGRNIRNAGYFVYSSEECRVKGITKLSPPAMRSFYTKHNAINEALDELFQENEYTRPPAKGCLGTAVIFIGAAFLLGKLLVG